MAFCGKENRDYAACVYSEAYTLVDIYIYIYGKWICRADFLCTFTYVNTGLNVKAARIEYIDLMSSHARIHL